MKPRHPQPTLKCRPHSAGDFDGVFSNEAESVFGSLRTKAVVSKRQVIAQLLFKHSCLLAATV